jgi:hypothetical protein
MESDNLEDLSTDGKILKYNIQKHDGRAWKVFMWLRMGTIDGLS